MAEIKVFKEKFEPVQYKIIDLENNEKIITQATPHTLDVQDKIEKIIYDTQITNGEKIWKQMVLVFGTDEQTKSVEFWKKFQLDFISQILEDFMATSKKK